MPTRSWKFRDKTSKFGPSVLGKVVHPLTVFRLTGIIPSKLSSISGFERIELDHPECLVPPNREGYTWLHQNRSPLLPELIGIAKIQSGLATWNGNIYDRETHLVVGACHKAVETEKYRKRLLRGYTARPYRILPRIKLIDEPVIALTSTSQHFYFHWLFDILPRLEMARQNGFVSQKIYLDQSLSFQKESLQLLGIETDRIIDAHDHTAIRSKELIVPCHQILQNRAIPDWVVQFLRRDLMGTLPPSNEKPWRRLYLSRQDASYRRVENELILRPWLEDRGFEVIEAGKLSFIEQMKLFREAKEIVAPHGSALGNLAFCSKGTRVVELFPRACIDLYSRISLALGLDHRTVVSEDGTDKRLGRMNYRVSLENLDRALA